MAEEQGLMIDPRDKTGKGRFQETSRPLGCDTYFTSEGDDTSNVSTTGGGELFKQNHISDISLTYVARSNNVATATCDKDHEINVGDKVDIDCNDTNYNGTEKTVIAVPSSTTFTYSNTGSDDDEKAATGSVIVRVHIIYIDLNIAMNQTWLHEGYISAKNAELDDVTLKIVPRTTSVLTGQTGTNYNLYNGYLVIPAAGDGTVSLVNDMTDPTDGLIYMPNDDQGNAPTAYWNADFNTTTKQYENITAAPSGNGRYNMFAVEVVLSRFVNRICLLGDLPHWMLQSADTAQLGQGMRLKAEIRTNGADHAWKFSCTMTLHRVKTC